MTTEILRKRGRWIPWMIVAFFVVVAIFDGIFVYLATSTHTGVVTEHAYDKGLNYNAEVAAAEHQDALGWQTSLDLGANSDLILNLKDKESQPLEGANVQVNVRRPTQAGFDFDIVLSEADPGKYSAPVTFPMAGQWDVRVFIKWKHEQYQLNKRLVVAN